MKQWRRRIWVLRTLQGPARSWALRRYAESRSARASRLAAADLGDSGRLVFVCHGNIMRSAFATHVARACSPEASARIVGAGTHAVAGRSAQHSALEVSRELSIPLDEHSATPLLALSLGEHDVIVCMDAMNEANVLAAYPALAAQVFRVGDVRADGVMQTHGDREIQDPYGRGTEVTRDAFERVSVFARAWVTELFTR